MANKPRNRILRQRNLPTGLRRGRRGVPPLSAITSRGDAMTPHRERITCVCEMNLRPALKRTTEIEPPPIRMYFEESFSRAGGAGFPPIALSYDACEVTISGVNGFGRYAIAALTPTIEYSCGNLWQLTYSANGEAPNVLRRAIPRCYGRCRDFHYRRKRRPNLPNAFRHHLQDASAQ